LETLLAQYYWILTTEWSFSLLAMAYFFYLAMAKYPQIMHQNGKVLPNNHLPYYLKAVTLSITSPNAINIIFGVSLLVNLICLQTSKPFKPGTLISSTYN
jgi:hypothetical protein